PIPLALAATVYGAAFGLFPIGWLVYSAILLFDVTVEAGCFDAIKQSLGRVSSDRRLLVLLIAFCFGAFIEGTSGFGTPVAVWAAALACGVSFAVAQFFVSNFIGPYLTDIISALVSAVALLSVMRLSKPAAVSAGDARLEEHGGAAPASWASLIHAWAPYIL